MPNAQTALLVPLLNGPTLPMVLHAAKSPIPDDAVDVLLADIVECDFPGYAAIPLTGFDETVNDFADVGEALTDVLEFTPSDALVNAQPIFFYYITRHPPGHAVQLMQVVNLPVPIDVSVPGKPIQLQVRAMCEGLV